MLVLRKSSWILQHVQQAGAAGPKSATPGACEREDDLGQGQLEALQVLVLPDPLLGRGGGERALRVRPRPRATALARPALSKGARDPPESPNR